MKMQDSIFKKLSEWMVNHSIKLSEEEIIYLREHTKIKHYDTKEYLVKEGTRNKNIFFITRGIVRTYTIKNDVEITLDFYSEGEFVSAISERNTKANFNIQALSPAEIFYWTIDDIYIFKDNIKTSENIEKIALNEVINKQEERKISFLSQSAQERYEALFRKNPDYINIIPVKIIASYLGVTPESMSRIRKLHK